VFASRLRLPFGITFYPAGPNPKWVYVAETDSVVRFPYNNGDLHATTQPETVVAQLPGYGRLRGGGHWTRDIRFRADGKKMYVSVGSLTNDHEDPNAKDERRADILEFDPDGKNERIYAYGIRNAVGLAIHPKTGDLWCSVNERDALGDNLVPDYITRVKEGGFYGWPWFYMGGTQDPRHVGEHLELKDKVLTPEVILGSHYASLCLTFYTGPTFPREFRNDGFASEHGSWNRSKRVGYKVLRIPCKNGVPTGEFEDFMTGFVTPEGQVWGRPVGVTVAKDGALMVTDDASGTVWRIQHEHA
jgi:glucose/arabinose dehydrogenase